MSVVSTTWETQNKIWKLLTSYKGYTSHLHHVYQLRSQTSHPSCANSSTRLRFGHLEKQFLTCKMTSELEMSYRMTMAIQKCKMSSKKVSCVDDQSCRRRQKSTITHRKSSFEVYTLRGARGELGDPCAHRPCRLPASYERVHTWVSQTESLRYLEYRSELDTTAHSLQPSQ